MSPTDPVTLSENPGDRPSRLMLGRLAAGELDASEAERLRASLTPSAAGWLQGVDRARAELAPFDAASLRARAQGSASSVAAAAPLPAPANDQRGWVMLLPALLLAALALIVAWPALRDVPASGGIDPSYVGVKAGAGLQPFHLEAGALVRYDHRALGAGDVLGFKIEPADHRGVVVLSVDGRGQVTVHWPERGESPEPLVGPGPVALPGTVVLDGAPGPEVFLAVFDRPVAAARAEVERAWQAGGQDGLVGWATTADGVDLAVVNRK
jgi:hypothetical protein